MNTQIHLVRHGETAWSKEGRHTGRTELTLTEQGEQEALRLAERLRAARFARVFASPRQRARRTCELAGWGAVAEIDPDLAEWDYGDYEGMRTAEILAGRPDWNLFRDGCPGGETPGQVSERADRVIGRLRGIESSVAIFSHGHFGRVLGVRWVGLPVREGQRFQLSTCSVSILGYEHNNPAEPVITLWNATH